MSKKNITFHYAILNYQRSMYDKNTVTPLAVIVISFAEKQLMVFGQDAKIEGLSEISSSIAEGVEDRLGKNIMKALKKSLNSENPENDFFDELAKDYKWNLFITQHNTYKSRSIKTAALSLFSDHIGFNDVVLHVSNHLEQANIPKTDNFSMGGTFRDSEILVHA